MEDSGFEEKRAYPRIPRQADLEVIRLSFPLSEGPGDPGVGRDIGGGGACIHVPHPFEPGTTLSLTIGLKGWTSHRKPHSRLVDMANEAPLAAIVEVVWCRETRDGDGWDMGVKFVNVWEDDHKALLRYLSGE